MVRSCLQGCWTQQPEKWNCLLVVNCRCSQLSLHVPLVLLSHPSKYSPLWQSGSGRLLSRSLFPKGTAQCSLAFAYQWHSGYRKKLSFWRLDRNPYKLRNRETNGWKRYCQTCTPCEAQAHAGWLHTCVCVSLHSRLGECMNTQSAQNFTTYVNWVEGKEGCGVGTEGCIHFSYEPIS